MPHPAPLDNPPPDTSPNFRPAFSTTKKPELIPAFLPHSTLRTTLNLTLMRRRRFTPVSYTRSDYCVFASLTLPPYQNPQSRHVTSSGYRALAPVRRANRPPFRSRAQGSRPIVRGSACLSVFGGPDPARRRDGRDKSLAGAPQNARGTPGPAPPGRRG